MVHLFLLCAHVTQVVRVGLHLYCYVLYNNYAKTLQTYSFYGIIRHQSQLFCTHSTQNMSTYAIISLVGIKAEMNVCFDCIFALFLEFVGADFVHQTDASTFLIEVDEDAFAFLFDAAHCLV